MKIFSPFSIVILLFTVFCNPVHGQSETNSTDTLSFDPKDRTERIIRFHSDIIIDTSGIIQVTEHIIAFANGNNIQRGIIREIPIYRKNNKGKNIKTDVNILSVLRNNKNEEYQIEKSGKNKVLYIGNKDIFLEPGIHEFTITYESQNQIGFFNQFDELYWNVTGNEWEFNIKEASASVTLPEGTSFLNTACYTGLKGSSQSECAIEKSGNRLTSHTNYPLANHVGFTIAVSFPKGIVEPPTQAEEFWMSYKKPACAAIGLIIFLAYFIITWKMVGEDPQKPTIIPRFEPPHEWSPAVTRFLYMKGYDEKAFTATLVNMAVKGAIRIHRDQKLNYHLEKIGNRDKLTPEEQSIFDLFFTQNNVLTLSDKNYKLFENANSSLEKRINSQREIKDYFQSNSKYITCGLFILLAILAAFATITDTVSDIFITLFPFLFFAIGIFMIHFGRKMYGSDISRLVALIVGCAIAASTLLYTFIIALNFNLIASFLVIIMVGLFILYSYLIKTPTLLGAQTISELEGFRMFLKTTGEDRFNTLMPLNETPELFEKLYPYAIALDVPNEWSMKFNQKLQSCNYRPDWYVSNQPFVFSTFTQSFTDSFGSSLQKSGSSPGSSSGSGWSSGSSGGGFSGGGGGGGGGRGW